MKIIKTLLMKEALNLLCKYGSVNKKEEIWSKKHSEYLVKSGRCRFMEVNLNKYEFMNLFFNGEPKHKKIFLLKEKIKKNSFDKNSYLFLRDLNENENGSFYVENGIHRVTTYKNLINEGMKYFSVSAVLFSKNII